MYFWRLAQVLLAACWTVTQSSYSDGFYSSMGHLSATSQLMSSFPSLDVNQNEATDALFETSRMTFPQQNENRRLDSESDSEENLTQYPIDNYGVTQNLAKYGIFATAIAGDGNLFVVGAAGEKRHTGAVYVYEAFPGLTERIAEIRTPPAGKFSNFGVSVDMFQEHIIVGANGVDLYRGSAYIYSRTASGTWALNATLSSTVQQYSGFGYSVSIFQNYAVVGTLIDEVYVFEFINSEWTQVQKIESPYINDDPANNGTRFGRTLSLYGSTLIIGAEGVAGSKGAAFIYSRNFGVWELTATLDSVAGENSFFGASVDIHSDSVIVGAPGYQKFLPQVNGWEQPGNNGSAYIYERFNGTWSLITALNSPAGHNSYFGSSVSLNGGKALVGAYGYPVGEYSGSAFSYVRGLSTDFSSESNSSRRLLQSPLLSWNLNYTFLTPSGGSNDFFGYALALNDKYVGIGAFGYQDFTGQLSTAPFTPVVGFSRSPTAAPTLSPSPSPTFPPTRTPTSSNDTEILTQDANARTVLELPVGFIALLSLAFLLFVVLVSTFVYCFCCVVPAAEAAAAEKKKKKEDDSEFSDFTFATALSRSIDSYHSLQTRSLQSYSEIFVEGRRFEADPEKTVERSETMETVEESLAAFSSDVVMSGDTIFASSDLWMVSDQSLATRPPLDRIAPLAPSINHHTRLARSLNLGVLVENSHSALDLREACKLQGASAGSRSSTNATSFFQPMDSPTRQSAAFFQDDLLPRPHNTPTHSSPATMTPRSPSIRSPAMSTPDSLEILGGASSVPAMGFLGVLESNLDNHSDDVHVTAMNLYNQTKVLADQALFSATSRDRFDDEDDDSISRLVFHNSSLSSISCQRRPDETMAEVYERSQAQTRVAEHISDDFESPFEVATTFSADRSTNSSISHGTPEGEGSRVLGQRLPSQRGVMDVLRGMFSSHSSGSGTRSTEESPPISARDFTIEEGNEEAEPGHVFARGYSGELRDDGLRPDSVSITLPMSQLSLSASASQDIEMQRGQSRNLGSKSTSSRVYDI